MRRFISILSAVIVLSASVAEAGDWADCWGWEQDPDRSIIACTKLIEEGKLASSGLSGAQRYRGSAYGEKGEHARAIADYNKAFELDPRFSSPYEGLLHRRPF